MADTSLDGTPTADDLARADRIRSLLKSRGWTQARAAKELGVGQSTVESWVGATKAKKPHWPHLARLADEFDVTPEWIETGKEAAEPADPVEVLRLDMDQLRGRVTQISEQVRFIAENRTGITRLEAAVADARRQLDDVLALLHLQGSALADLLQEQVAAQTAALADRRGDAGRPPSSGERRKSRGRRQTDP